MAASSEKKVDVLPWLSEPDQLALTDEATGYPMQIARGPGGHLCGYVGLPADHPWFGKDYSATVSVPAAITNRVIDIDKVGAINLFFSALKAEDLAAGTIDMVLAIDVHGGLTFADKKAPKNDTEGLWWLGFDCAHAGDLCPRHGSLMRGDVYRDIAYVEAECRSLARQLASFAKTEG